MKGFKPDNKQNEGESSNQFNLRINVFFFSTFILFCIIIVRLAILQFVEGPQLQGQETGGQSRSFPLQPIRGSIVDASGTPLAYSTASQSLYITLLKDYSSSERGQQNRPEIEEVAEQMVKVFDEYGDPDGEQMTVDDVIKAMDLEFNKQPGYEPRRIKSNLTPEEVAYFLEHKNIFAGVEVVEESSRHYNTDRIAVQTIGYLREFKGTKDLNKYKEIDEQNRTQEDPGLIYTEQEKVGVDGLEMMFQEELRGKNGYISIPINPQNMAEGVPTMVPPEKGYNVHSTIHKDIQLAAQEAILEQLQWLHTNPVSGKLHRDALTGYAVAMEVDTGNIVAMASMPDYDPNVWENGSDDWESVMKYYRNGTISPYSSGRSGNNLESVLLLGSTVKPLSVLIGLNENLFGVNEYYPDIGYAQIGKDPRQIRNSGSRAFGSLNAITAIQNSSNAYMIDMVAERLFGKYGSKGLDVWNDYMEAFGLGVSTGSGLPNEFLGRKEYNNVEQMGSSLASLAFSSFGQGGKYTTLQLAQYAATLANRGERIKPQLATEIVDHNGNVVKKFEREVLNKMEFSKEHWDAVIKGMNTQGLRAFDDFRYDFARKTGTSEQDIYINGTRKRVDNGVFIAFAPRENPKLAVAVVIPEGGFGSQSAAPIARKIFDAYDEIYGLDGTPHPKQDLETEQEDGEQGEGGENQ
ncbi:MULTISPECIES: peptidoglycan D,D-transpeptidase FtsI family protein [Paenibacillus]|uniref:Cell division protein FtsI n=1 Tax=Paenibacillus campinasensis TaxID=66347 RepID=A0A268EXY5_9BACL|nr:MULTISPECIES: penicillin-binding transpeptidase domain-containing protein [Paenibacillus]MUG66466.1 penicillin-binding protein 2 [Paenibacillus campinasensis]PAD77934.1 cell division protein FtsI [Paenibacillus campinasensis]PAK52984.1 cell division protein FtsI [Paenibacillus sp. 7541]